MGDLEALGESGGGTTTVGRRLVPSAPWQKPNLFLFWGGANSHFWDGTIQFLRISFYPCQSLKTLSFFHFLARRHISNANNLFYYPFCEWLCYLLNYAALQTKPTKSKMAGMMLKMMNPLGSVPSMPSVGEGKEDGLSREERLEQERANKEEMIRAEKERKQRYLKGREVSEK